MQAQCKQVPANMPFRQTLLCPTRSQTDLNIQIDGVLRSGSGGYFFLIVIYFKQRSRFSYTLTLDFGHLGNVVRLSLAVWKPITFHVVAVSGLFQLLGRVLVTKDVSDTYSRTEKSPPPPSHSATNNSPF